MVRISKGQKQATSIFRLFEDGAVSAKGTVGHPLARDGDPIDLCLSDVLNQPLVEQIQAAFGKKASLGVFPL
jgi:hypothetical protein